MEQIRIIDLIGWAITALGWYLVWRSARSGDNHQEIHSIVEKTEELILDVEITARRYWVVQLDEENMKEEMQNLIVKSNYILRNISNLSDRSPYFGELYRPVKEFQEAILGQNGESLNRDRLSEDDSRITRIMVTAENLHNHLRKAYNEEAGRGWLKLRRK